MRTVVIITVLLILTMLTGCADYYYQEGKTFQECKQARLDCFEDLKKYSSNWQGMGQYEFEFMEKCMKEKGYSLAKEADLPLRIKRDDPDQMLHWKLRGVAGTLDN